MGSWSRRARVWASTARRRVCPATSPSEALQRFTACRTVRSPWASARVSHVGAARSVSRAKPLRRKDSASM
jgi:hypothetical protein